MAAAHGPSQRRTSYNGMRAARCFRSVVSGRRATALLPDGLVLNVPAGSDFIVQYHFHPTGKPEVEKSQI
jgi:hypothetical protein